MHPLDASWEVVKQNFDAACSHSALTGRRDLISQLNQMLRSLRQYEDEAHWVAIVTDSLNRFIPEWALFELTTNDSPAAADVLRLRAQTGLQLPDASSFAIKQALAFDSAIASKDPVLALRTAGEVSPLLSAKDKSSRAHVIPILNGSRVVAVLFAVSANAEDLALFELLGGIASLALARTTNRSIHTQIASAVSTEATPVPAPAQPELVKTVQDTARASRNLPPWADLPDIDRSRHIQAQRFARVTIAELQLGQPDAIRSGRSEGNLYVYLKRDLDRARETYRKQFMQTPSMVDYLHMELISVAAAGDPSRLGSDYPGPLA